MLAKFNKHNLTIYFILLVSILLRIALAFNGGQYFLWDESRARRVPLLIEFLTQGNLGEAIGIFFEGAHPGFLLASLPAYAVGNQFSDNMVSLSVTATFLSLYSVVNIWLIYKLAYKVGASKEESLLAMVIFATANTMYYLSRHLLPYDSAITFSLIALLISLENKPNRRRLITSSVMCLVSFFVYSGNWLLILCVIMLIVIYNSSDKYTVQLDLVLYKLAWLAIGFLIVGIICQLALFILSFDTSTLIYRIMSFSESIVLGSFSEGWSFPLQYFWATDNIVFCIWLVGILLSIFHMFNTTRHSYGKYWLIGLIFLYSLIVLVSTVLQKFVMYDRLVRQILPFIALTSSYGYWRYLDKEDSISKRIFNNKKVVFLLFLLVMLIIINNFYQPLSIVFPDRVIDSLERRYQDNVITTNIKNIEDKPALYLGSIKITENNIIWLELQQEYPDYTENNNKHRYWFMNFHHPFWKPYRIDDLPPGSTVYKEKHPLQYKPYQFLGYTPEERQLISLGGFEMRIIDTEFYD